MAELNPRLRCPRPVGALPCGSSFPTVASLRKHLRRSHLIVDATELAAAVDAACGAQAARAAQLAESRGGDAEAVEWVEDESEEDTDPLVTLDEDAVVAAVRQLAGWHNAGEVRVRQVAQFLHLRLITSPPVDDLITAVILAATDCESLILSDDLQWLRLWPSEEAATPGSGPAPVEDWRPFENETQGMVFLLIRRLRLSEVKRQMLLDFLRHPGLRIRDVPATPAFYDRAAKVLAPTAGHIRRVKVDGADKPIDVLLPSEWARVFMNSESLMEQMHFLPCRPALNDPAVELPSHTRVVHLHPMTRIREAVTPDGQRFGPGSIVRIEPPPDSADGWVATEVLVSTLFLAPPPGWKATAEHRHCPEKSMVLALTGELLLTAADVPPRDWPRNWPARTSDLWRNSFGILAGPVSTAYVTTVSLVYVTVMNVDLSAAWPPSRDAGRVVFEKLGAEYKLITPEHRACHPYRVLADPADQQSPELWAALHRQPTPHAAPWDYTTEAAAAAGLTYNAPIDGMKSVVLTAIFDGDAAKVSKGGGGYSYSHERCSIAFTNGGLGAFGRRDGYAELCILPEGVAFDTLACTREDLQKLEHGVVMHSRCYGRNVHVRVILVTAQVDSPVRFKMQGMLSFASLEQMCGICRISFNSTSERGAIFASVLGRALRTDGLTLDHLGEAGFPATAAPYVEHLASFDCNLQIVIGKLHFCILGVFRKGLKLLAKRHMSLGSSALSALLSNLIREFDAATRDVDRQCGWTAKVRSLRAAVKFFNGELTQRFMEVVLFAIPEVIACGKAAERQQRVDAMRGLVQFMHGLRYAGQEPLTERAVEEAARLMESGIRLLDAAFPPCGRKGEGANGIRSVLPHLTVHIRVLLLLLGHTGMWNDAICEARHQLMKAASSCTNRGDPASWPNTMFADMHGRLALALAIREGRYGAEFVHPLGRSLVEFASAATPLAGELLHASPSYYSSVTPVALSFDDATPRPVDNAAPVLPQGAVAALPCWCCPEWQACPGLVCERRAHRSGAAPGIAFTYAVGAVPSKRDTHTDGFALGEVLCNTGPLLGRRLPMAQRAWHAAYPGAPPPAAADWQIWSALKYAGGLTVQRGDWVLIDRSKLHRHLQNIDPATTDPVAVAAAATLDPRVAVLEDYAFWPQRFSVARVRNIVSVFVGGIHYPLIDPVYYEFETRPGGVEFACDTAGARGCGVGTDCFIIKKWDGPAGAATDETMFPAGLVQVVPNVVHYCTTACKVKPSCVHGIHELEVSLLDKLNRLGCNCSPAKREVSRMVHSCPSASTRWLVSAFDMGKAAYVQR